jgi:hypothetical protein
MGRTSLISTQSSFSSLRSRLRCSSSKSSGSDKSTISSSSISSLRVGHWLGVRGSAVSTRRLRPRIDAFGLRRHPIQGTGRQAEPELTPTPQAVPT